MSDRSTFGRVVAWDLVPSPNSTVKSKKRHATGASCPWAIYVYVLEKKNKTTYDWDLSLI